MAVGVEVAGNLEAYYCHHGRWALPEPGDHDVLGKLLGAVAISLLLRRSQKHIYDYAGKMAPAVANPLED
jgi:hypothetical protein